MTINHIRTLLDATPRNFGYGVVEYDLTKGTYDARDIHATSTKMRMETEGAQFEASQFGKTWVLVSKEIFYSHLPRFESARKNNNYEGDYIHPVF